MLIITPLYLKEKLLKRKICSISFIVLVILIFKVLSIYSCLVNKRYVFECLVRYKIII